MSVLHQDCRAPKPKAWRKASPAAISTSAQTGGTEKGSELFFGPKAPAERKNSSDPVVVSPLLKIAGNWRRLLSSAATEEEIEMFRQHERTGRVLGDEDFQKRLEKNLGRVLRRQKPGPKRVSAR
jgi:hypothetical protein